MTLVEMLVALTATLIMMGLLAQLFSMLGKGVNGSRNVVALGDRMRATQYTIRQDLNGITAPPVDRPLSPERNQGYFEYVEGPDTDRLDAYQNQTGGPFYEKDSYYVPGKADSVSRSNFDAYVAVVGGDNRLVGDVDDVLLFTTRTVAEPFAGRLEVTASGQASSVQSPYAEVAWFCVPTPNTSNPQLYTLHRRQRLVMAYPGAPPFLAGSNTSTAPLGSPTDSARPNTAPSSVAATTDISCRIESGRLVPNTLGDLSKRENRFLRAPVFPYVFNWNSGASPPYFQESPYPDARVLTGPRLGEDIVLTNVISFDVKIIDPTAEVRLIDSAADPDANPDTAVNPGEAGYSLTGAVPSGQLGAPVDLDYNRTATNPAPFTTLAVDFSNRGRAVVNSGGGSPPDLLRRATYDTWSSHYESNGLDDDGDTRIDEGTNGIDDDSDGLVDEPDEAETQMPYPIRVRGMEIRIRCYEPTSQKVRQVTIRHSF